MNIPKWLKIKKYKAARFYGKDRNILILLGISLSIASILFIIGILELLEIVKLYGDTITGVDFFVFGLLCSIGPIGFYNHIKAKRKRAVENHLPDFLREISSSTSSGMTVFDAIISAANGDHGTLTPELQTMASQLSWGISVEEALLNFGKRLNTPSVKRMVVTINKALEIGGNTSTVFEAAAKEDLERLRNTKAEDEKIQKRANIIVANIFRTLSLLHKGDIDSSHTYSRSVRALQSIAESHRDIIVRTCEHFENFHAGFVDAQKEELRHIKTSVTRLLWNTSIMLMRRKKVDYDYIANQCEKLKSLVTESDKNQIERIQKAESKTRLSILFYGLLENTLTIAIQTQNLLSVFRESFEGRTMSNHLRDS